MGRRVWAQLGFPAEKHAGRRLEFPPGKQKFLPGKQEFPLGRGRPVREPRKPLAERGDAPVRARRAFPVEKPVWVWLEFPAGKYVQAQLEFPAGKQEFPSGKGASVREARKPLAERADAPVQARWAFPAEKPARARQEFPSVKGGAVRALRKHSAKRADAPVRARRAFPAKKPV
jgi:hypothetical protein